MEDSEERLQEVFRDVFDMPDLVLKDEMAPGEFDDWDSVQTVQLVLAIEREFSIKFTTDEVASIKSARVLKQIINQHLG